MEEDKERIDDREITEEVEGGEEEIRGRREERYETDKQ